MAKTKKKAARKTAKKTRPSIKVPIGRLPDRFVNRVNFTQAEIEEMHFLGNAPDRKRKARLAAEEVEAAARSEFRKKSRASKAKKRK